MLQVDTSDKAFVQCFSTCKSVTCRVPKGCNARIAGRTKAEYREENKQATAAYKKAYNAAHPEAVAASQKAWREAHKETEAVRNKVWREENSEAVKAHKKAYRAAVAANASREATS